MRRLAGHKGHLVLILARLQVFERHKYQVKKRAIQVQVVRL